MLKYLMKLRSRKAFTLVELVIAVAILAILMVSVAAFSGPVQDMVKSTASDADAISANKIMGDYIQNRLAFADKLTVLHAVDAEAPADTTLTSCWSVYQTRLTSASAGAKDKAGALIIKYEEDVNDPLKSTYKIYDVLIPDSGAYGTIVMDGAEIDDEHGVFIDDFYENSQNLFLFPTTLTTNKARGSTFLSFDIMPYDCDPDYPTDYITSDTLKDYYEYKLNHEADPTLYPDDSFGLNALKHVRGGAIETVSFEVQNLKPVDVNTNWTTPCPGGAGGTDIVVFYYIPHY